MPWKGPSADYYAHTKDKKESILLKCKTETANYAYEPQIFPLSLSTYDNLHRLNGGLNMATHDALRFRLTFTVALRIRHNWRVCVCKFSDFLCSFWILRESLKLLRFDSFSLPIWILHFVRYEFDLWKCWKFLIFLFELIGIQMYIAISYVCVIIVLCCMCDFYNKI